MNAARNLVQTQATLIFIALFNERTVTVSSYSGKSVGPRAGFKSLKSHSPWYRRIQTYTCRQAQAQESEINLTAAVHTAFKVLTFSSRKRCGLHDSESQAMLIEGPTDAHARARTTVTVADSAQGLERLLVKALQKSGAALERTPGLVRPASWQQRT